MGEMMKGILVGCDQNQEWLLSWWWDQYSAHNSYPVVFVDFGMSKTGVAWCNERGTCIPQSLDAHSLLPLSLEKGAVGGSFWSRDLVHAFSLV